jgi:hypothetical protein
LLEAEISIKHKFLSGWMFVTNAITRLNQRGVLELVVIPVHSMKVMPLIISITQVCHKLELKVKVSCWKEADLFRCL